MSEQLGRQRRAGEDDVELALLLGFLATSTRADSGTPDLDVFTDLERTQAWLTATLTERAVRPGVAITPIRLDDTDLVQLRSFREELRTALSAGGPALGRRAGGVADVVTSVDLHWSASGDLAFHPAGHGWQAIAALITMELLLARAADRLRRLKTCAAHDCGYPFVDHSPNLIRAWHDTSRCGNVQNLRASRARRQRVPQT